MGSIEAGGDLGQVTFRHRISPLAERKPACVRQRGPDFFVPPLSHASLFAFHSDALGTPVAGTTRDRIGCSWNLSPAKAVKRPDFKHGVRE